MVNVEDRRILKKDDTLIFKYSRKKKSEHVLGYKKMLITFQKVITQRSYSLII